jgi:hypothetical protein
MTKHSGLPDAEFTAPSSAVLNPLAMERALARIGYFVTTKRNGKQVDWWAILDWFVKLTTLDLTGIDAKPLREKQAEYRALQETANNRFNSVPPSATLFVQLQAIVKTHLDQAVDQGRLTLGPFPVCITVYFPANIPGFKDANQMKHRVYSGEFCETGENEALVYLMGRCLERFGDMLRRCQYCSKLFLQKRRVLSKIREGIYCKDLCRALYRRRWKKAQRAAVAAQAVLKHKKIPTRDSKTRRRASDGEKGR